MDWVVTTTVVANNAVAVGGSAEPDSFRAGAGTPVT